jgi:hypothetical protein
MSTRPWGYRSGPYVIREYLMDSATAAVIAPGDFVVEVTHGYVGQCAAGGLPIGVAVSAGADPGADGGAVVLVSTSPEAVYEMPPDAGSVTQALVNKSMDVGGAQTVDITTSDDDVIQVVGVDTERNTVFFKLKTTFTSL